MMFETETTQQYPISVDSKEESSQILAQNRVSQVFWEPIKNRVSPRSALLEAVYLEALLYIYSEKATKVSKNIPILFYLT